MGIDLIAFVVSFSALAISLILHELMHAWTALKLGDPTARDLGRITLNPLPHVDLFMTIVLPTTLYFMTGGRFIFGGPKPAPINPLNFRDPGKGMMISAAAGPLTNFALALASGLLLALAAHTQPRLILGPHESGITYVGFFLGQMVFLNLFLALLNLIPVPPLDGSRILRYYLPSKGQIAVDRLEYSGMILVIFAFVMLSGPISVFVYRDLGIPMLSTVMGEDKALNFLINYFTVQ